jgi:hypothetical protein
LIDKHPPGLVRGDTISVGLEVTAMALDYGRVHRFVLRNDRVDLIGAKLTILKNGEIDRHGLIEAKDTRFVYNGKEYSAEAFEMLVRADEQKAEAE